MQDDLERGQKIAIIGGGLMGTGITQIFASHGYDVKVYDVIPISESKVLKGMEGNLSVLHEHGKIDKATIKAALQRVSLTNYLKEACKEASFIIECVPENLSLKQALFKELDELCDDDVILASNTSVLSITEIASQSTNTGRIVGTHFWNPPFLIPLVEVIKTQDTTEDTMIRTMEVLKKVGKHPIRVNKDVPGFIANRLQHALWREALSIVERGIADAATVDEALKYGPGLRLPHLAPLENADMVGLDLTLSIHSYILKYLEDSHEPSPLLKEKVAKGELGFKTGKGYQEWTPEQADARRRALSEYLIKVL